MRIKKAFTLIELLLAISVMGVSIGFLLPAAQKVREAASRIQCANNMKQLSLSVQSFSGIFKFSI